jgi:hypothetical protein
MSFQNFLNVDTRKAFFENFLKWIKEKSLQSFLKPTEAKEF